MSANPASVLGADLAVRIEHWLYGRQLLWNQENSGDYPHADEWHDSDDEAAEIVNAIAELFEIRLDN